VTTSPFRNLYSVKSRFKETRLYISIAYLFKQEFISNYSFSIKV
jgi:hypothetical protein